MGVRHGGSEFQTHAIVGILVMGVRQRGGEFQTHPIVS